MNSKILLPNGTAKAVKNLGWILRHWQRIEWLGFNYSPDSKRMVDGEFVAQLKDGTTYITEYASLSVFWNFVDRPVFRGLPLRVRVNYDGPTKTFTVGDGEFKAINRLEYKAQIEKITTMDLTTQPA